MAAIVSALLAALPGALLRVIAPLLTEQLIAAIARRVLVRGLRKFASITDTTIDDEIVEEMIARLEASQ